MLKHAVKSEGQSSSFQNSLYHKTVLEYSTLDEYAEIVARELTGEILFTPSFLEPFSKATDYFLS